MINNVCKLKRTLTMQNNNMNNVSWGFNKKMRDKTTITFMS